MKNYFILRRSKWLLLTLFMLLIGGSSVWADAKTLPYSYGFEDYNLATDGWTTANPSGKNSGEFGITGTSNGAVRTGSYGFRFSSYSTNGENTQYLISPELSTDNGGITVSFYYKASSASSSGEKFKVGYSTTDTDLSSFAFDVEYAPTSTTWTEYNHTFPAGTKYIAIYYYANYQYRLLVDDFTFEAVENIVGPAFAIKDGTTTINSPYAYNFGLATAGTTKTFTLSNPGTEATPISIDISGANGFTVAVEDNATSIPAGGEKTLTITMPDATASGSIVVTPTGDGLSTFTFNVSGTLRDPNKVYLDFSDGQMPDGWTSVQTGSYGSAWSASTGYISQSGGSSSYAWAFTSPKLNFENGEVIFFETAKYSSSTWYNPSVTVEYTTDATGATGWTAIGSAFTDDTYGNWIKRSVTIPVEGIKRIRFNGWYIHMRNIYGGQLPLNPTPKDLAYSNLTNTSAQLSWTSTASNFNIQYKATGDADWTTIENATANPYTLTGLAAVTTYQVKVQADHGVNGLSDYTDPISFTTKPNPISAYPYTENFNSLSAGEIPQYWDNSEGTTETASYKWVYYASGHEGACVRFNSYNNYTNNTNFLKTRPFDFTEGQAMKLSFWYKNPTGGDFSVYASTDGGLTFPTELATGLTGKTDWTLKEIDIPAAIFGSNVVIVFKGTSNYANGDAYLYLDDITISEVSDYSMSISGSDVSENTIAFGTVKNTTTTKTFTITNDGGEDLIGISVVSSDATVFTVSDTGFDLASGATKNITVTFVKDVAADYEETITISQANIATDKVLTVTATYAEPTPATMAVTLDEVAVGETVAFGTVNKATTKTFKVSNTGEATLNATISVTGTNAANFTLSTTSLEVAGESNRTFTVTFYSDDEDAAKTATVTLTAAGLSDVSFNITGTYVDMWSEDFEGGVIPAGWDNSGFIVKQNGIGTYPSYNLSSYFAVGNGGSGEKTLTTPLLTATAGDKLTFDGFFCYGDETLKVDYSIDRTSWNNLYTYDKTSFENGSTHNIEIESAVTGTFYLRFTVNYFNGIDNIVGFKLAPAKTHDASITAKSIPATGNQYVEYTASVTVKELLDKADEVVTAELWIGTTKVATKADVTLNANATKVIELTFTPDAAMSGEAYIKVYNGDESISLTSDVQAVTIAAALILDESTGPSVALSDGSAPSVVVNYTAKAGWNTICMPFALNTGDMTAIFGDGWKAYEFKSYADNVLTFEPTTTFYAGYPFVVYSETPANTQLKKQNVTIDPSANNDEHTFTFQGTYAPMAAGTLTDNWGLTAAGKIAKAKNTTTMKGFRAYFIGNLAGARVVFDGDETTGIHTIEIDNNVEGVYNMQGQKVDKMNRKGLYIINGKKVVK